VKHLAKVSTGQHFSCAIPANFPGIYCWGSNCFNQVSGAKKFKDTSFASVSAGTYHACAIPKGQAGVKCWGRDTGSKEVSGAENYKDATFTSVSAGYRYTCAILKGQPGVFCWGLYYSGTRLLSRTTAFTSVTAGTGHACAIRKDTMGVVCWGPNKDEKIYLKNTIPEKYRYTAFTSVSAGQRHTCAIPEGMTGVICWGSDTYNQVSGADQFRYTSFTSVSAGVYHTCAIPKGQTGVRCWGRDRFVRRACVVDNEHRIATVSGALKYKSTAFVSVSASEAHTCAVTKGPKVTVKCWGRNELSQSSPPAGLKLKKEPSCMTEHPKKYGPTACTACDQNRKEKFFTIIDPRTNSGTCTATPCPACKPRACCGDHHKHFVVNTISLTGVCVRHNDDCTPVCMPRGERDRTKPRVCSKGCNQLLKVERLWGEATTQHR